MRGQYPGVATMTTSWTSAFGRACGVLLDTIVRWLALSRINPNVLTFMGLVVNTWAAILFGSCRVGFMERPERLVLVILGALFNRMAPVLWVIAVLSTITVIHRMRYTWTRTQDPPVALTPGQAA